jgi:hypothetical protein
MAAFRNDAPDVTFIGIGAAQRAIERAAVPGAEVRPAQDAWLLRISTREPLACARS